MRPPEHRPVRDYLRRLSPVTRRRTEIRDHQVAAGSLLASAAAGFHAAPVPESSGAPDSAERPDRPDRRSDTDFPFPGGGRAAGRRPPRRRVVSPGRAVMGRAWQASDSAGAVARSHPLETIAVVALGLGGVLYPPVWLIGAALALFSKTWDLRDKWAGIGGPVVLVVFGTVAALMVGGQRDTMTGYVYEAWLAAGRISRVAAALGAAYLLWQLLRGPRQPRQPPWNVPHRFG